MPIRMSTGSLARMLGVAVVSFGALLTASEAAWAQRVLGLDVSYWQSEITQSGWNTAYSTGNRQFVFIRSSRGGTTGLDQPQGTPGGGSTSTLSRRYDDPRFVQNITRATNAGLFASAYHFARPDILTNTGADEADHFIQMAGAWMRPGYLPPMYDLEAGQAERTQDDLAQFSVDFSNRIYQVMKIRPSIYTNGNYANDLAGASASLRNQLAQPPSNLPSVASPGYPTLVSARWPAGSGNPYTGDIQNGNPKDAGSGVSYIYGPWDDYGVSQPWNFWQYSSGEAIPGLSDTTVDADVAQGDLEYVKDQLIPAVWWNDSSGDWSTLGNWNSGQAPVAPATGTGQASPYALGPLPTARLPGAAGSGPTSGQYDTVILERQNANITVTLSTGTHNIRKMYMRETLNISGGSLTINYDPNYNFNVGNPNALRSGPISAQFSGPVTLSGTGSLSVNTLQVDATRTLTLAGSSGALTFKQINLIPHSTTPAKIAVTGDVNINPLSNSTATISNGSGSGSSGYVDLSGGTRAFNIGNGSASVDLDVAVPITNGGLTKNGAGTMRLSGNNTFAGPVTVNAGELRYNHSSGLTSSTVVTVNNGGTLDMNGITDIISALASTAGHTTGAVLQGAAGLTLSASSGTFTYGGTITGTGTLTKTGGAAQILSGNNSLGPINITAGTLLFNGTNTTGNITVSTNAVIGGTGSVSGAITLNNLGQLAPGASIESFGMGALTLNAGSVLNIDLGAGGIMDTINVTGLLTLAGNALVNLTDLGGMSAGTYTLIDYGTISGSVATLGTPNGPAAFNYSLIDTGNAIDLRVSIPGDFNFDNQVDAGDYALWRKGLGTTYSQAEFNIWRAHYGEVASSGAGLGGGGVPEPTNSALLFFGLFAYVARRRVRS